MSESWRWTLLEDLDKIHNFYASAGLEGDIWLPDFDGIHHYDGDRVRYFHYPEEWERSFPNGSHVTATGEVYVSTEHGLRCLREGK